MDYESQLNKFKKRSVNQVFDWLLVLICIAVPFSLIRWIDTGFLPIYIIHILVISSAIALFFFRRSLPAIVIEVFLICCCFTVGIGSTITFAISGNAVSMFMLLMLLLSISRNKHFVFFVGGLYVLCLCIIGYFYSVSVLVPEVDLQQMMTKPMTWVSTIIIMVIAGYSAINALLNLFALKNSLLDKISLQNKEIQFLANHDNLTGLPTLRLSEDRLNMAFSLAKRNSTQSYILFLDLDGFKQVNDSLGHDVGDHVLKVVAEKLQQLIRDTDTCCRIGGDEFLIIVPDISDTVTIENICQRLITNISEPISYMNHTINIGASIGGANYPDDATEPIALKRCADQRMYEVKKNGKNNYQLTG